MSRTISSCLLTGNIPGTRVTVTQEFVYNRLLEKAR
jgi:hypothetical protein